MAADTGNSEPLCPLWWLMDVRCYVRIALLTQWVILFKMNSIPQILKTSLNTNSTCQKTHAHKTYPQHILETHRKHIQNIKNKQKHIFKVYTDFQILICYTGTFPIYTWHFSFSHCSLPVGKTSGRGLRAPKLREHFPTGPNCSRTSTQQGKPQRENEKCHVYSGWIGKRYLCNILNIKSWYYLTNLLFDMRIENLLHCKLTYDI